jgi:hypothetical protein
MEGEGLEKGWGKLADGAIPGAKEINCAILPRTNQGRGVFDRLPECGFGHPHKTHGPNGRIVNRGIEEYTPEFLEHPQLFVGRAGDSLAPVLQFLACRTRVVPEALI